MKGIEGILASRDGDQFHYHWAARQCLALLKQDNSLTAISIEGVAKADNAHEDIPGEEVIDVALYGGGETLETAQQVRYTQLKHSTARAHESWTASGLNNTLQGFAKAYQNALEQMPLDEVQSKFSYTFTTNRPVDSKVIESIDDLSKSAVPRHPAVFNQLLKGISLPEQQVANFFRLVKIEAGEPDLWAQQQLLIGDVRGFVIDGYRSKALDLKELVNRRATTYGAGRSTITQHDVLQVLGTTEAELAPAACLIAKPERLLIRAQEARLRTTIMAAEGPFILHAEGGLGKTTMAWRLARDLPAGSVAVLFDCFGNGQYRGSSLHHRHAHREVLTQISTELAALGLCLPLVPSDTVDNRNWMQAFMLRLTQAIGVLRATQPDAQLHLIFDAADNAVMAAQEVRDRACMLDLIRTPMPAGVKLIFTCRTHRQQLLDAPLTAQHLALEPFELAETREHLASHYDVVSDAHAQEFARLTNGNPRVQAFALNQAIASGHSLEQMLNALGPTVLDSEASLQALLDTAIQRLHDGHPEAERVAIDAICQGLALLRPLVPISILARVAGVEESAVRSFATDLSWPLLVKGEHLHFQDEPSETWFRQQFSPDQASRKAFLERLRPLATRSPYVAAVLPALLLSVGQLDELVQLSLTRQALPTDHPIEIRDIEVQRLQFALKACLQDQYYADAIQLMLKLSGELTGESRQVRLIQNNPHLAARLLSLRQIEELVSRRVFKDSWMGSRYLYSAALMAEVPELAAEARSHTRMARHWFNHHLDSQLYQHQQESWRDNDLDALLWARLMLHGCGTVIAALQRGLSGQYRLDVLNRLAKKLIDLGKLDLLEQLTNTALNPVDSLKFFAFTPCHKRLNPPFTTHQPPSAPSTEWLLVALLSAHGLAGQMLPSALTTALVRKLMAFSKAQMPAKHLPSWITLGHLLALVEQAAPTLTQAQKAVLAEQLNRKSVETSGNVFHIEGYSRVDLLLTLKGYAVWARLQGDELSLDYLEQHLTARDKIKESYRWQAAKPWLNVLMPWVNLYAKLVCNQLDELSTSLCALHSLSWPTHSRKEKIVVNMVGEIWAEILSKHGHLNHEGLGDSFIKWASDHLDQLYPLTLTKACYSFARVAGAGDLALHIAQLVQKKLQAPDFSASDKLEVYNDLIKALIAVDLPEAQEFFSEAVACASGLGEEHVDRWQGLLALAKRSATGGKRRPQSVQRLAEAAKVSDTHFYEDRHLNWEKTVKAVTALCPASALSLLSQWRDQEFGEPNSLLCTAIETLVSRNLLNASAPIVFSPFRADWRRCTNLIDALRQTQDQPRRQRLFDAAYRYIRVSQPSLADVHALNAQCQSLGLNTRDLKPLIHFLEHPQPESNEAAPPSSKQEAATGLQVSFSGVGSNEAQALSRLYQGLEAHGHYRPLNAFISAGLAQYPRTDWVKFANSILAWGEPSLYDADALFLPFLHIHLRSQAINQWLGQQMINLAERYPCAPFENTRIFAFYPKALSAGLITPERFREARLKGLLDHIDTLNAEQLLSMIEPLSHLVTADDAERCLHFGIDLLNEEISRLGADAHISEIGTDLDIEDALAGYLWVALGSPEAAVRWQAAHAVRVAIELHWDSFLLHVLRWAQGGDVQGWIDPRFVFYRWHAKQWLLIALTRAAQDQQPSVGLFKGFIQASIREEHVLIRHLAAQILLKIPALCEGEFSGEQLSHINDPAQPIKDRDELFRDIPPDGSDGPHNEYFFGYDIGNYWLKPLGEVFGLNQSQVEKRIVKLISKTLGGGTRPSRRCAIKDLRNRLQKNQPFAWRNAPIRRLGGLSVLPCPVAAGWAIAKNS